MIHVTSGREHPFHKPDHNARLPTYDPPQPRGPSASQLATKLRCMTSENADMRKRLDMEKEIETAQKVQTALYELFTRLESSLAPKIVAELELRASDGHSFAHMNFDREDFADTGIGRPRDVARMFLAELANPSSAICTQKPGLLAGVTFEVWNNQKFTVRFSW